jgi:hypothetical protein
MDTLNCAPDGASVRSRSPSRSLEVAPQHPPTTPIRVTESQELVMTPDVVTPVDTSCPGCLAPTRRLKHTCTKARSENKRHTSPSVDSRHAKRSGTGSAPALTATEAVQIPGSSLAIDFGSDVGVRAGEMHVLSEAPSHMSSSSLAPAPSHMPVPTPTLEQGEATEVDGDVVMAEGDAFARDTRIANQAVDGLAPRACQHEVVPPPSPARVPSAEENDHLFLPPEGSFVCVALQDGVLPPELHVFTNIGTCIVVTRVEALSLPVAISQIKSIFEAGLPAAHTQSTPERRFGSRARGTALKSNTLRLSVFHDYFFESRTSRLRGDSPDSSLSNARAGGTTADPRVCRRGGVVTSVTSLAPAHAHAPPRRVSHGPSVCVHRSPPLIRSAPLRRASMSSGCRTGAR